MACADRAVCRHRRAVAGGDRRRRRPGHRAHGRRGRPAARRAAVASRADVGGVQVGARLDTDRRRRAGRRAAAVPSGRHRHHAGAAGGRRIDDRAAALRPEGGGRADRRAGRQRHRFVPADAGVGARCGGRRRLQAGAAARGQWHRLARDPGALCRGLPACRFLGRLRADRDLGLGVDVALCRPAWQRRPAGRAAHRRAGRRAGPAGAERHGRRDRGARADGVQGLLELRRGQRVHVPRRLAPHRRHGPLRCRRLPLVRRPLAGQGTDQAGRRERLPGRGRARAARTPGAGPRRWCSACPTRSGARRSRRCAC